MFGVPYSTIPTDITAHLRDRLSYFSLMMPLFGGFYSSFFPWFHLGEFLLLCLLFHSPLFVYYLMCS